MPNELGQKYPAHIAGEDNANELLVDYIRRFANKPFVVAEIGCQKGATTKKIQDVLYPGSKLFVFDFKDKAEKVARDIGPSDSIQVIPIGNSYRYLDSYCWSLADFLAIYDEPFIDFIYLDGSHTWAIDGYAFFLLDLLLKVDGHIWFDDYSWTFAKSPSLGPIQHPESRLMLTDEQLQTPQVKMIIELLVKRTGRYSEVVTNRCFKKRA